MFGRRAKADLEKATKKIAELTGLLEMARATAGKLQDELAVTKKALEDVKKELEEEKAVNKRLTENEETTAQFIDEYVNGSKEDRVEVQPWHAK